MVYDGQGSIDSLAQLAHPSGFVYVVPCPRSPFPPGTLLWVPLVETLKGL